MSEFTLPEGMTADRLRELVKCGRSGLCDDCAQLTAWADAIDLPESESAVTDEMVDLVARECNHVYDGHVRDVLEAVERLGRLRGSRPLTEEYVSEVEDENRRLAAENNDLRKRLHDLDSAADNPGHSAEAWPTDEQVEAAAEAVFLFSVNRAVPWERCSKVDYWLRLSRAALEAVAPPPADGRLEMAEGLLRRVTRGAWLNPEGASWWISDAAKADVLEVTPAEADYLRSLDEEGGSDE